MEFRSDLGANWGAIRDTALILLLFGFIYNLIVHWAHRRGYNDGLVWLEVVFGVAVTLLVAAPTIGWEQVAVLFIYFACSGFFMAAGDLFRYLQALWVEYQGVNGDQGERVAK